MLPSSHGREETIHSKRAERKADVFLPSLKAVFLPIAQVSWEFAQPSMQKAFYPKRNHPSDESSLAKPVVDKASIIPCHLEPS